MLFRKMLRDLWKNRTQFLSIFLMSFVGMAAFAGLDAESTGGHEIITDYYETYNLADYWIDGSGFDNDEISRIEKLPGVKGVEKRCVVIGKDANDTDKVIGLHFLKTNEINKLWVKEGLPFEEEKKGFYIEELYAKANNIRVGDKMAVLYNGERIDGIVEGICENPEYVYYVLDGSLLMPNYGNYSFVYLSDEMYPDRENIVYNQLLVDSNKDSNEDTGYLKDKIEKVIDRKDVVVTDRRQNASFSMFDDEMTQHKAMGVMFSVVFIVIAFLGIITTMTRVTANQRTQIGTLKALGFSKRTITLHYISYGVIITALGDILGAAIGIILFPAWIFPMFEGSYLTPPLFGKFTTFGLYGISISIALAFLVSLLSCRKQLKDMPAITLKPEAPKISKANRFERSRLWQHLPFSTQWNFRDIARNKVRTLMGIIGIAGCAMIMLAAFSMDDSMSGIMDMQYRDINTYTTQVGFEPEVDNVTKREYARKYKGQLIQNGKVEIASKTKKTNGSISIVSAGSYIHVLDKDMKPVRLNKNGIALTYRMCQNLGVSQGDFIKWHLTGDDKWQYTRVDQVIRNSVDQGIVMTDDMFESLKYTFEPTSFATRAKVPSRLVDDDDNIMSVVSLKDLEASLDKSLEMMNQMIVLLVACAVLLGVIVLYNLGILSFTEKTREVATLKVLGFKSGKIRNILQEQNVWITAVGIVCGIPLGKLMMVGLCMTLGEQMDLMPLYSLRTYIYTIGGTFAVSMLVNFMFSGKVKTINMVDALKGVE